MTLDEVAVIPSSGIGDGLIMMVAAHRLACQGYNVTTFSKPLMQLKSWFQHHNFKERPEIENAEEIFSSFDLIVLQNDNSPLAKLLIELFKKGKIHALSTFYPSYEEKKHDSLLPLDRVFDATKPMVDNIARAISSILGLNHISKNNGLLIPFPLSHRKYKNRVIIHPSSKDPNKNWCAKKYVRLAKLLENEGFYPVFAVSLEEQPFWIEQVKDLFDVPSLPSLSDLASLIYESGFMIGNDSATGHLSSNMQLPTLIISNHEKRMKLWRPGWYKGDVITPSKFIPNFKGSRLRETKWQHFISEKKVFKHFQKLQKSENFL